MTLTYGFYDSVNGDRRYNAEQMSSIFDGLIEDGVYMNIGTAFTPSALGGMSVGIGTGRAWFNHTWSYNDSIVGVTVPTANGVHPRIDTIVLEIDTRDNWRHNRFLLVQGTPAASPVAPTLTNTSEVHQYPICNVYVGAGVTEITSGNITYLVGTEDTPYVTGILDPTFEFGGYLNQFTGEVQDLTESLYATIMSWFNNLENQLTTNQAVNLQNQITDIENSIENGWVSDSALWTFPSPSSGSVFDLTVSGNKLDILKPGSKLKWTQQIPITYGWMFNNNLNDYFGVFQGTPIGTLSYVSGHFDEALSLNGIDNGVALQPTGNDFLDDEAFTLSYWIKTETDSGMVFAQWDEANSYGIKFELIEGRPVVTTAVPGRTTRVSSMLTVNDGEWHNVVISYRLGYAKIYVDGNKTGGGLIQPPEYGPTTYTRIGCTPTGESTNTDFLEAELDDLYVIFDHCLDAKTIKDTYLNGDPFYVYVQVENIAIVLSLSEASPNTLVRLFLGNEFKHHATALVLTKEYSNQAIPLNFNPDPITWTLFYEDREEHTTLTPSSGAYIQSDLFWDVPLGKWYFDVEFTTLLETTDDPGDVRVAFSNDILNIDGYQRSPFIGIQELSSADTVSKVTIQRSGLYDVMGEETFYFWYRTECSTMAEIGIDGTKVPIRLEIRCPYI